MSRKLRNFIKVNNDDQGQQLIALLKTKMKECNSVYKLRLKGRKPTKESGGWKEYPNGCPISVSQEIALYLDDEGMTMTNEYLYKQIGYLRACIEEKQHEIDMLKRIESEVAK